MEEVEMAPAPTIDRGALVEIVRSGGTLHGEKQAKPYANSLENLTKLENRANSPLFKGFFCLKLGQCQLPCAVTYNFFPLGRQESWDDFYCFPTVFPIPMLLPIPVVGCCTTGGFDKNVYKFEGEGGGPHAGNGHISSWASLMVIDEERGTLACYMPASCSEELEEHPCVTCSRLF